MRVTRFGVKALVFYLLLFVAFFAAPYLNLFFLLLAFCSVLAGLNLWWALRNLSGVTGAVEDIPPMPAGASHPGKATLIWPSRERHHLRIVLRIDGVDHGVRNAGELVRSQRTESGGQPLDLTIPGLPRGIHPVERAQVRSVYPLGLLELRRPLAAPSQLVVYPAPADLSRYRDRDGSASQGLGGSHAEEMGPSGLREYRDGDELRTVHWRASARRHGLVVKEFEGDAAPGQEVLLDLRALPVVLEEALSLVAALALQCQSHKELLTLHTQDHRGTYGEGHSSFDGLFRYLAAVTPLDRNGPPPPAVSPSVLRLPLTLDRGAQPRTAQAEVPC